MFYNEYNILINNQVKYRTNKSFEEYYNYYEP